jgi:hypothetical protein
MKLRWVPALLVLTLLPLHADLYYLDHPVPVSLKHGEFMVAGRLQSAGGIMARAGVGLFDRLTLGLSYSVDSFFGPKPLSFPPLAAMGFQARLLGLEEGEINPAIMVGYESQGYDGYQTDKERFVTLPPGGYLVLGKTIWPSRTDISIGANYLPPYTETSPSGFDGHIAVREFYFPDWDFILEYDLALNDHGGRLATGLFNFAIARTINGNVALKLALRDILSCHTGNGLNRVFDISFQQHF